MPLSPLRVLAFAILVLVCAATVAQEPDYRRPDFSLPDLEGQERSIAEWDGKAVLINFWATWCIPCKREIPMLNQLASDYEGREFQVLGIAVDKPENINKFMRVMPLAYPTLAHEERSQDIAFQFSNSFLVLPFTVFLDHEGRVFWMQVEEIHRDEVDMVLKRIWQVKNGELGYEDAQLGLIEDLKSLMQAKNAD